MSNRSLPVYAVTCTDDKDDARLAQFAGRLERLGYHFVWLNCTAALHASRKKRFSWGVRLQMFRKFVEQELSGDPLVFFLDAFDMVSEGSAAEAAERFMEFGTSLVLSCVDFAWPHADKCPVYASMALQAGVSGSGFSDPCIFPSPGAWTGYRSAFRLLFASLNFAPVDQDTDDQCWLANTYHHPAQELPDNFWTLDKGSRIFFRPPDDSNWSYALDQGRHVVYDQDPSLRQEIDPRPTFVHLEGIHPNISFMAELHSCEPGSAAERCDSQGKVAGRWPEKHE